MKSIAWMFFVAAAICFTLGMSLGLFMAASQDHALSGAHAHLNLVGWVTLALFGLYYHLTPAAATTRLARLHLIAALAGVALMVPGIAVAVLYEKEGLAIAGSVITFASGLIFLVTLLRHGLGQKV